MAEGEAVRVIIVMIVIIIMMTMIADDQIDHAMTTIGLGAAQRNQSHGCNRCGENSRFVVFTHAASCEGSGLMWVQLIQVKLNVD